MTATTDQVSPLLDLAEPFPPELDLTVWRSPTRLTDTALAAVMSAVPPRVEAGEPLASIVVVTYDNLAFTRLCLHSLLAHTESPDYEVIVVDNASTDGTVAYLQSLAELNPHLRLILNETNRGFAAANNQGLAAARGQLLVLLNNDAIVSRDWLGGLRRHLQDEQVGCVCACTNRIGNEAEIECSYRTYGELQRFAARRMREHARELFDIPMAPMFCLAMRRGAFEKIGPIDEQYERGMFEDDDYSMRVRAAGLRACCADDVFVHHFGGASFGNLLASGEHGRIFRANRERFEAKWGVTWQSHRRRRKPDYEQLIESIRAAVAATVPPASTIAVISRGDEELLKLEGQRAWHFPRLEDGQFAGHYPADSDAALAHLREQRQRGAQYLLIPQSSNWWLEHYPHFARHLDQEHRRVTLPDDSCVLFDLRERGERREEQAEHWQDRQLRELVEALVPPGAKVQFVQGSEELVADVAFVAVPERRAGWLDQYPDRARQFDERCRLIADREQVGRLFAVLVV